MDFDSNGGNKRVFHRLGNKQSQPHQQQNQKVCFHWQAGRCTRTPCAFLHRELPLPPPPTHPSSSSSSSSSFNGPAKRAYGGLGGGGPRNDGFSSRKNPSFNNTWGRPGGTSGGVPPKKMERVCNYWVQGKCSYGDGCKFLHSWSIGGSFSLLTTLEGHQKVVTGITLPSGDKLYTGSKDEHVRIWDCASGQCVSAVHLGGEIGCMISEGPWVFIGLPNMVKALNIETVTDMSLSGPVGQVYSLMVGNDMLFAGIQVIGFAVQSELVFDDFGSTYLFLVLVHHEKEKNRGLLVQLLKAFFNIEHHVYLIHIPGLNSILDLSELLECLS